MSRRWIFPRRISAQYLGHVHITPEEFQNVAFFLRLGLPSTIIRRENGTLRKHFSNRRDLKTPGARFSKDPVS